MHPTSSSAALLFSPLLPFLFFGGMVWGGVDGVVDDVTLTGWELAI